MERLERHREKGGERITATYSAEDIIEQVFTSEESRHRFINTLIELTQLGAEIKVGGRRLREMLGCKTFDFAEHVIYDAFFMLTPLEELRLGLLLEILKDYPTERMTQPDLDFFIWNVEPEIISNVFESNGFEVTRNTATGVIWVINIKGDDGTATFVDGEQSWQTGDKWPMFAVFGKFSNDEEEAKFNLDFGYGRMFLYPMSIPMINKEDPLDPVRVAAIGRALLWFVTSTDPEGFRLRPPFMFDQDYFWQTVFNLPRLIREIKSGERDEAMYRSGIRDLALALRVILLSDWDEHLRLKWIDDETHYFLTRIEGAWSGGCMYSHKMTTWPTFENAWKAMNAQK